MCETDWNLIIQFLIAVGTISVAALAIWGDKIKYFVNPPKLNISIANEEKKGVYAPHEKAYYHLKVVNKNWTSPAKTCKNFIERNSN